ncbi:hypothetical protein F1559_001123 [Cyanidiococcus yangmingshanensis]|uniref:Uncharacterized protein n=1 Tax=Cyanidiococcus yangmingshanensis TaxID=2690220 RepID=A0A7J7IBG2_9RHOD|nr:hypothetical protein F1559_001123 [Cyanidiococcus yangmingshanensis]
MHPCCLLSRVRVEPSTAETMYSLSTSSIRTCPERYSSGGRWAPTRAALSVEVGFVTWRSATEGAGSAVAWAAPHAPGLIARSFASKRLVCRLRRFHAGGFRRNDVCGWQVWRRARGRNSVAVCAHAFRADGDQDERTSSSLAAHNEHLATDYQSKLQQVLQELPRYAAYRTALEAVCGRVAGSQEHRKNGAEKPLSLDSALALLGEMQNDQALGVLEDAQKDELVTMLLDAMIRAPAVEHRGQRIRRLVDDRFGVGYAAMLRQLWDLEAINAFGAEQERTLRTHPPPRVRFFDSDSIRSTWCLDEAGLKVFASLAPLPSDPREELMQTSVGLGFLALSSMAILGEVVDPLVFHRSGNEETLILTLLFGSYALDRFIYLFQGRISDTVDKGLRRLIGGNEEREALCDAASFVVAYMLGISDFAFRPRARLCLEWLTQAHQASREISRDGDEEIRLWEEQIALYTVWLLSRTAIECCVDKELIESETRQARIFVQESLREQIKRLNAASDGSSRLEERPTDLQRVQWEDFTLRWAFIEAMGLVRANMSIIRQVATLMLDGRTVGECVTEIERTWRCKQPESGEVTSFPRKRPTRMFHFDSKPIPPSRELDPGVMAAISVFRNSHAAEIGANASAKDRTAPKASTTIDEFQMNKADIDSHRNHPLNVADRAQDHETDPSSDDPEASEARLEETRAVPAASPPRKMDALRDFTGPIDTRQDDTPKATDDLELAVEHEPVLKTPAVTNEQTAVPWTARVSEEADLREHDAVELDAETENDQGRADAPVPMPREWDASLSQETNPEHDWQRKHQHLEHVASGGAPEKANRDAHAAFDEIQHLPSEQTGKVLWSLQQVPAVTEPNASAAIVDQNRDASIRSLSSERDAIPERPSAAAQTCTLIENAHRTVSRKVIHCRDERRNSGDSGQSIAVRETFSRADSVCAEHSRRDER